MVERRSWRRFLNLALSVSSAAFVVGLLADGFWGGTDGETTWVDQSFGFVMYLAGAFTMLLAVLLVASQLIAGAYRLLLEPRAGLDLRRRPMIKRPADADEGGGS